MKKIRVTEREYDLLTKRLEFFDTTRNNILTFSFTAVITIIGIALSMNLDTITVWICLVPFCLIIPFTARISYYRLASAHISSFLRKFAESDMRFTIGSDTVKEGRDKYYTGIAWLVNHEMVILSVATSCVFYIKYIYLVERWSRMEYLSLSVPIVLSLIVYIISDGTYNYKKIVDNFVVEWNDYADAKKKQRQKG